jgi:hypothetical protein
MDWGGLQLEWTSTPRIVIQCRQTGKGFPGLSIHELFIAAHSGHL